MKKEQKKRTPWPKDHAVANYRKRLHLHPLRKPKQLLDYEVGSRDNASNEETARAGADIAVTQPIKTKSKIFTRGSNSSWSKQCLQQDHC